MLKVIPVVSTLGLSLALALGGRALAHRVFGAGTLGSFVTSLVCTGLGVVASLTVLLDALLGIDAVRIAYAIGNQKIYTIANTEITPATILVFALMLAVTWYLGVVAREGTIRTLRARRIGDAGTVAAGARLVQYTVATVGLIVSLQALGINLDTLVTAGAVFAVSIGFALQNIAQNFVSGVILLAERSISPGDIVVVEGMTVRVKVLGIRSTIGVTLDDAEVIIPNSYLVQSNVTNLTLSDSSMRIRLLVGVAYESDVEEVQAALREAAVSVSGRMPSREPVVALMAFGASSVDFEVSVWTDDPWKAQALRSELGMAVFKGLGREGITIAFPQLDVHVVSESPST